MGLLCLSKFLILDFRTCIVFRIYCSNVRADFFRQDTDSNRRKSGHGTAGRSSELALSSSNLYWG